MQLACRRAWQFVDDVDFRWTLEAAQVLLAVLAHRPEQLGIGRAFAAMRYDECHRSLAEALVRPPHHGAIPDARHLPDDGFDFLRIKIDPTGNDHVVQTIGQIEVTVGIAMTNIAEITLSNMTTFERGQVTLENCVTVNLIQK